MKRKALLPFLAVAPFAYVAFHPGVAQAEPHFAGHKPTAMVQQGTYPVDALHSSVYFDITHMGLAKVHGRFNKFSGTITVDPKDVAKGSVDFTIDVNSVDTGVTGRDDHLRNKDYFEVTKWPEMKFKSKRVEKSSDGYVAVGDLTIKDKTKEISIPFKHYGPVTDPSGQRPARIGVICEPITIKRSDFGVGTVSKLPDGTLPLSDEVTVRLSLEATEKK